MSTPKCINTACLYQQGDECWRDNGICSDRDIPPKQTNADRIRAMSDEELAELLYETETQYLPIGLHVENDWLEWLKQEVE